MYQIVTTVYQIVITVNQIVNTVNQIVAPVNQIVTTVNQIVSTVNQIVSRMSFQQLKFKLFHTLNFNKILLFRFFLKKETFSKVLMVCLKNL